MAKVHLPGMFALTILFGICFPAYAQSGEQPTSSPTPAATSPASQGDSTHLIVINAPKPVYPMAAAKNGVQGKVWIQLLISETGDVESADIISGDPDLARAAQEAMKKWKFKPYIHNGKPVKVNTKMPFDFAFKDKVIDANAPPDSSANAPALPTDAASTSGEGSSGNLPHKLRVSSGVAEGLKLHDVQPIYPPEARRAHIQGEVLLQATIGKDGLIHDLKVVKGDDPLLIEAAKGAVEQWRYRPYILKGNPVEVETTIKVVFHM
ncbi:MAG TPA: energy transducer TonB [Candidatus Angelobacter sp.]|jgi:TonB family protein